MFVFLDESGNTGTNWLDINQPYFVYAGWITYQFFEFLKSDISALIFEGAWFDDYPLGMQIPLKLHMLSANCGMTFPYRTA